MVKSGFSPPSNSWFFAHSYQCRTFSRSVQKKVTECRQVTLELTPLVTNVEPPWFQLLLSLRKNKSFTIGDEWRQARALSSPPTLPHPFSAITNKATEEFQLRNSMFHLLFYWTLSHSLICHLDCTHQNRSWNFLLICRKNLFFFPPFCSTFFSTSFCNSFTFIPNTCEVCKWDLTVNLTRI